MNTDEKIEIRETNVKERFENLKSVNPLEAIK